VAIPPVFDAHLHVQPWHMLRPDVRDRLWRGRDDADAAMAMARDPSALLRFLDAEHIEKVVLVNYVSPDVMGFTEETNTWIADYVRGHEDRLLAVGSVHPRFSHDPAADVERLASMGIRALKLHPPHQIVRANAYVDGEHALRAMYAAAARCGLPLIVHTGTSVFPGARNRFADPMPMDDVALDFPDLRIVLAHGGRPLYTDTCFFLARRHANVWIDVSGIPPRSLLRFFPKLESIADKVLWGTDWPAPGVPSPKRNVEQFWSLPLSESSRLAILRHNARRVFES
jgi:predicted TIM-barrel fold metal-dependent hydrolase